MDGSRFDRLTRTLSSRRTAVGGLLAGLLLPLDAAARKKGKDKQRKRKGRDKQRAQAQLELCWRAGACIAKKGANVSQCNLEGYSPNTTLNCTGCNASRANLRGAQLQGANFTKANLSGACLVDANFTGATFANNTNLSNAIFCRTIMPDGTPNNSGCGSGTPCCPTCDAAHLCPSGCCDTAAGACGACTGGATCGGGNPGIPGFCGCTGSSCGCPAGQKSCNDACIPATGCCQDSECNDNNLCTTDACVNNVCVYIPITCNDNNACTTDSCDPELGCVFTAITCNDNNPCTTDTCDPELGCIYTPILCDDGLQCTADTCVNGVCVYTPDLSRCGPASACEEVQCGRDRDCLRIRHNEWCPLHPHAPACMASRCAGARCEFEDICGASHPDCGGCASCACNQAQNRCVRACPS